MCDRSLDIQLSLAGGLAAACIWSPVAEPVETGLPVVRMATQAGAHVCVDVVPAAPRFDGEQLSAR
jgi:hypothetical protein